MCKGPTEYQSLIAIALAFRQQRVAPAGGATPSQAHQNCAMPEQAAPSDRARAVWLAYCSTPLLNPGVANSAGTAELQFSEHSL